jgi:hypothetical protein
MAATDKERISLYAREFPAKHLRMLGRDARVICGLDDLPAGTLLTGCALGVETFDMRNESNGRPTLLAFTRTDVSELKKKLEGVPYTGLDITDAIFPE